MKTLVFSVIALGLATFVGAQQSGSADRAFVTEAAMGGMAEVEMGKLAVQKASSAAVKQFGQRMSDDHNKANDELKSIAARKNITLPSGPGSKHKETYDRLSRLSGQTFDREYMTEMVSDHRQDVAAFRNEAGSGSDADVKAFAAKTLPTLEAHLKQAEDTSKVVGAHAEGR